jgi:hypothetical protein
MTQARLTGKRADNNRMNALRSYRAKAVERRAQSARLFETLELSRAELAERTLRLWCALHGLMPIKTRKQTRLVLLCGCERSLPAPTGSVGAGDMRPPKARKREIEDQDDF